METQEITTTAQLFEALQAQALEILGDGFYAGKLAEKLDRWDLYHAESDFSWLLGKYDGYSVRATLEPESDEEEGNDYLAIQLFLWHPNTGAKQVDAGYSLWGLNENNDVTYQIV